MRINPGSEVTSSQTETTNKPPDTSIAPSKTAAENFKTEANSEASKETVTKAVTVVNEMLKQMNNVSLKYSVDDATRLEVVKMVDNQTGQTIKQYPPKEILGMLTKMYEMWGIFVDKKFQGNRLEKSRTRFEFNEWQGGMVNE